MLVSEIRSVGRGWDDKLAASDAKQAGLESDSVACTAGWDHPLAETAKLGSIGWPDLQAGSFDVHGAKPAATAISLLFEKENGLRNSSSRRL